MWFLDHGSKDPNGWQLIRITVTGWAPRYGSGCSIGLDPRYGEAWRGHKKPAEFRVLRLTRKKTESFVKALPRILEQASALRRRRRHIKKQQQSFFWTSNNALFLVVESILLWAIWRLVKLFSYLLKRRCLHIITCGLSAFGMVVAVPKPWKLYHFFIFFVANLHGVLEICGDFFCFQNFQIWLIQAGSSNWFTPWFDLLEPPLPHFLDWIASHWRNNKDMLNWLLTSRQSWKT